jgi:two-component system response regulator HydG
MDTEEGVSILLVVDDEEGMRETLTDILEEFGFDVDSARDGREAVDRVGERDYDLLLMDIKMPEMDGVEALMEIKSSKPEIPVVMMTAYADSSAVEEARAQGAQAVVYKPLDLGSLLPMVQKLVAAQV